MAKRNGIINTIGNGLEIVDLTAALAVVNLRAELAVQTKDLIEDLQSDGFTKAQAEAIVSGKA